MNLIYPILIAPSEEGGFLVTIPDLEINTQGESIGECIEMARDAIGMWGLCQLDAGNTMPQAATYHLNHKPEEIVTLVDIDMDAYGKANAMQIPNR